MKQWLPCGPLGEVAEVTPRGEEELSDIGAEPANERDEEQKVPAVPGSEDLSNSLLW